MTADGRGRVKVPGYIPTVHEREVGEGHVAGTGLPHPGIRPSLQFGPVGPYPPDDNERSEHGQRDGNVDHATQKRVHPHMKRVSLLEARVGSACARHEVPPGTGSSRALVALWARATGGYGGVVADQVGVGLHPAILDDTSSVASPAGGPTSIQVTVPCGS
jgi:hypothetical protein